MEPSRQQREPQATRNQCCSKESSGERVQSCLDHARDEADHKTIWLHPHLPTDGGLCPR